MTALIISLIAAVCTALSYAQIPIVGWVGIVLGIVGWVVGAKACKANPADGKAKAGKIIGMIITILAIVSVILAFVLAGMMVGAVVGAMA